MTDWNKLKVVDLKAELKARGLSQVGLKQALVERLADAEANPEPAQAEIQEEGTTEPPQELDPEPESESEPRPEPDLVHAEVGQSGTAADVTDAPVQPTSVEPFAAGSSTLTPGSEPERSPDPPVAAATAAAELAPEPQVTNEPAVATTALDIGVATDFQPEHSASITEPATPPEPLELLQDMQKRKRRSASPIPSADTITRKRVRIDKGEQNGDIQLSDSLDHPLTENGEKMDNDGGNGDTAMEDVKEKMPISPEKGRELSSDKAVEEKADAAPIPEDYEDAKEPSHKTLEDFQPSETHQQTYSKPVAANDNYHMDYERDVAPAMHPATSALYIKNFMRPLRANEVQAHLLVLATPPNMESDEEDIKDFYLDQIRTHAFVTFRTISAASRVRTALHDTVWPDERNRKALWVDFVPPEKVRDWIETEESQGGGRSGPRWEVVYEQDHDGNMVAHLDSGGGGVGGVPSSAPGPAPVASRRASPPPFKDVNAIPLGPRNPGPRAPRGMEGPPSAPRGDQRAPWPRAARHIPDFPGGPLQTTRAGPPVTFQTVSEELAQKRLAAMKSFYTQDVTRDMGAEHEINRYTFEQGDAFVDRGQEVFIGIRPPHREAERRRQMTGGAPPSRQLPPSRLPPRGPPRGGGPPRSRPLSDRYLPGINDGGPYREGDRDGPRHRFDDDRRSGYNNGRARYNNNRGGRDSYRDRRY